jgi:ureidoacrylate peracid hydrolase
MLTTLRQKVDPRNAALIVVDVQNDFAANGGAFDVETLNIELFQEMIPRLVKFIDEARKVKVPIIYIQNSYNSDQNWYLSDAFLEQAARKRKGSYTKRPVAVKGTWGWEFYDGIKPLPNEEVVAKHRFSAFVDTDLDLILRSKNIKALVITGIATNVCVETTARMGFMKDYYIVVVADCCASYSNHLHETALENIETIFGQVVIAKDVVKCWVEIR